MYADGVGLSRRRLKGAVAGRGVGGEGGDGGGGGGADDDGDGDGDDEWCLARCGEDCVDGFREVGVKVGSFGVG